MRLIKEFFKKQFYLKNFYHKKIKISFISEEKK
jgi:hypothetical protein